MIGFPKTLRPVLQAEVSECGLACLAMVSQWHGNAVGLRELRRRFPLGGQAMSLKKLSDASSQLGFSTRGVRVELDELPQLATPCILHWGMAHYVVLRRVKRTSTGQLKSISIVDPARGAVTLDREEASRKFTGVALELSPNCEFRSARSAEPRASLKSMFEGVDGVGRVVTYVLLLAVAIETMALASPLFLQWVVDTALVAADLDLLYVLAAGFAVLIVTQAAISLIRSRIVLHASTRINIHWSASVFAHLMRLPLSYFHKRHLGEILSRFGSISTIQRVLSQSFVETIIDGVMSAVTLGALLLYSPVLAAVVCFAVLLYTLIRLSVYARMRNTTVEMLGAQALEQSLLLETAQSMQPIKLYGRESLRQQRWGEAMIDAKVRDAQVQSTGLSVAAAFQVLFGIENVVVITLAGLAVIRQELTVGMIYALLAYKATFTSRTHSLIDKLMDLRMLSVHLERLADIVLEEKEDGQSAPVANIPSASTSSDEPRFKSIEFRGVWFRYSDVEPWVLEDLNFVIRPGESTCLVGPSGRGKTTVLRLLLGTIEPSRGEVLVDGVSIRSYGIQRYRHLFASVMQDDRLLSGTLEENISFFEVEPNEARIVESAKAAVIHDDIARMPLGYASPVGELGSTLSGGQMQRVLLARAVYRQPSILVLDEATSHLDIATEARVNAHLAAMRVTKIVVSHRPDTIRNIDRTVHLDRSGSHEASPIEAAA